jgi:hypothetical protein
MEDNRIKNFVTKYKSEGKIETDIQESVEFMRNNKIFFVKKYEVLT